MSKEEIKELVFQSIGQASMCWTETPKGVFKSEEAKVIGDKIMAEIDRIEAETRKQTAEEIVKDLWDWFNGSIQFIEDKIDDIAIKYGIQEKDR